MSAWDASPVVNTPGSAPPTQSPELPAALLYYWVGETRSIPGLNPPAVESNMKIDAHSLTFHATEDWDHPLIRSSAAVAPYGDVVLTVDGGSAGCVSGDIGVYDFILAPSGRRLEIHATDDPCATRVAALSGTWTRSDCPDNHLCLGDLDAGQHVSVIYTPFVRFNDFQYDYGRFAYTVPDGWTNPEDNPDGYVLVRRLDPRTPGSTSSPTCSPIPRKSAAPRSPHKGSVRPQRRSTTGSTHSRVSTSATMPSSG